jgi:hypothetical protein
MSEHDLRWRLRQLPRELDPPRDLWPGIEGRLHPQAAAPRRRPWLAGLALAASLSLAVGLAWHQGRPSPAPLDPRVELVQREAQAMTLAYQQALNQLPAEPAPDAFAPALATLDRSADEIQLALASDPGAVYLLEQLRRTYARRLSLTQRAMAGSPEPAHI